MKQFLAMLLWAVTVTFLVWMSITGREIGFHSLILSTLLIGASSIVIGDSMFRMRRWVAFSKKPEFKSLVPGHEGDCFFTWRNWSGLCNRLDGGVTGWYKCGKQIFPGVWYLRGKEFHGIVKWDDYRVFSTKGTV